MYSIENHNNYKKSIKCTHHNQIQSYTKWFCLLVYVLLRQARYLGSIWLFLFIQDSDHCNYFFYLFLFQTVNLLAADWPVDHWHAIQNYLPEINIKYICMVLSIWLFRKDCLELGHCKNSLFEDLFLQATSNIKYVEPFDNLAK